MNPRGLSFLTLPLVAALPTFLAAATATAAPCVVPQEPDPSSAGDLLRDCVDQVNAGQASTIEFDADQIYAIAKPLEFTQPAQVYAQGQSLAPQAGFNGDALIVINTECLPGDCPSKPTMKLNGFVLKGNGVQDVRALQVRQSEAYVSDVAISGFDVAGDGAGVFVEDESYLELNNSTLSNCTADRGGAVFGADGQIILDTTDLVDNNANNGGAAAVAGDAELKAFHSRFEANMAAVDGGAIYMVGSTPTIEIYQTDFMDNEAADDGGAVHGGGSFTECVFDGNVAFDLGGGAYLGPSSIVEESTFIDNVAYRGGGVAVLANGNHDMFIRRSTFANNTALPRGGSKTRPAGGGVYVGRAASGLTGRTRVTNSTVSGNQTLPGVNACGGGFALFAAAATLEHVTLFGNEAIQGGSIYTTISAPTDLELRSSIIAGSTPAACFAQGTTHEVTSLDDDGSCGVTFPGIDPQLGPLTNNGGSTETHVPSSGAVMDVATCYSTVDQNGNARPTTGCDIGSVDQ